MKILSSLLLIVGVLVCVKIAHAYGATACTQEWIIQSLRRCRGLRPCG